MDFQTQLNTTSQSQAGGASASMANQTAAAQHQAALASSSAGGGAGTGAGSLSYMSPYIRQDFLAQEMLISIMPKFELGRIQFLNAKYGPFSPNYPVNVPLWLALFLRETNTCSIRPPPEMSVPFLTGALQFEADHDNTFHPLPFHFFSIVRQILRYASSDIPDAAVVHRLLDELEQRRISKITKNLNILQQSTLVPPAFALPLTSSEWLFVKATLLNVMNDAIELSERTERRLHRTATNNMNNNNGMFGVGGSSTTNSGGAPTFSDSGSNYNSAVRGTGGDGNTGSSNSRQQETYYQSSFSGENNNHSQNQDQSSSSMFGSQNQFSQNTGSGVGAGTSLFNNTDESGTYYSGGSQQGQQGSSVSTNRTRKSLRG